MATDALFTDLAMGTPILYSLLGSRIKEYRLLLGLTQERLASELNVSRASLANVETGRQKVLVHQLYRLAEKLDVKITDLLPDPEELERIQRFDNLSFSRKLTPEERQQIAPFFQDVTP